MSIEMSGSAEVDSNLAPQTDVSSTRAHVESWIDAHGVGLEMKVAGAFRRKLSSLWMTGVDHGRPYVAVGPQGEGMKIREVDVVIKATRSFYQRDWLTVWLVVECKSSKDSPWVLYRDALQTFSNAVTPFGFLWGTKQTDNMVPANIGGYQGDGLFSRYGTIPCYSLATTSAGDQRGNVKNPARDAVLQVLSAVNGVRDDAPLSDHHDQMHIFVPVIVTSAPMFTITLREDGVYDLAESTREVFNGRLDVDDSKPSAVWVVAESEIEAFAGEFVEAMQALDYRSI